MKNIVIAPITKIDELEFIGNGQAKFYNEEVKPKENKVIPFTTHKK